MPLTASNIAGAAWNSLTLDNAFNGPLSVMGMNRFAQSAGTSIGNNIVENINHYADQAARIGVGVPTRNTQIQKLTTYDENNPEVLNWPKLYIYEFIPVPNPEFRKVALRAIQGPSQLLRAVMGEKLTAALESGATGELADIAGRYLQHASRGDKIGFDKGTDYIKGIFGDPKELPVWRRYELPVKDLKFIDVDTTSSWATDGLYKGDLTAKASRNVPVMPLWKAESLNNHGKTIKFDLTLVNRDYQTAVNNRSNLINLAQGMYWSQSDATQVSPHIYKLFVSESNKPPPDDPHSIGILKDADGNETGRNALLDYGIMWYMEWAALGLTVDYAGQIRDGLPEEYKISLTVKSLVPDCLNTTVFGWDHARTNAPELIKWATAPKDRLVVETYAQGMVNDGHWTPEQGAQYVKDQGTMTTAGTPDYMWSQRTMADRHRELEAEKRQVENRFGPRR